jgi:autotransporter-associated beta strand protein
MNILPLPSGLRLFSYVLPCSLLLFPCFLSAAEHSLINSDVMGTASFNSGLNWDDGQAPKAGDTYVVPGGKTLRSPEASGTFTFAGDALTLMPGCQFNVKVANNSTVVIPNLILQGGQVFNGVGGTTQNIHGNILIPEGAAPTIQTGAPSELDRREFSVLAALSGSGALNVFVPRPTSDMRAVYLMADNTAFTGPVYVSGSGKLVITNETGLGGNPPAFNPRQLSLNGSVLRLEGAPATVLDDLNRGIWLSNRTDTAQTITPGGKIEVRADTTATVACLIGGEGPLTKLDTGTLILAATNTYTGATTVNAGTLLINGATNATASLTVLAGAALGGTGTVHGAVTFAPGAGVALAGNGYGTLTFADTGGIALENAALSFDLRDPADGPSDLLALSGPLTLSGASVVTVTFPVASLPAGTYTLATYPSLAGGGTLALVPNIPNTQLVAGPTALTLEVSGSGAVHTLTWAGDPADNTWDGAAGRWTPADAAFEDGMDVLFDDAGVASAPVTLAVDAAPRELTIATTNNAYTLGTGDHTLGASLLCKYGTGALTLNGSYAVDNLNVGWDSGSGFAGGGAVTLNGNLEVIAGWVTVRPSAGTFNQAAASVISGSGGVTYGSEANIRGANTYSGVTTVGYAQNLKNITIHHPLALGSTNGGTVLRGGTTGGYNKLILANGVTVTNEPLTVAGGNTLRAGLWMTQAGAAGWDGDITVTSDGFLQIGVDNSGGTLTVGSLGRTVITNAGTQSVQFRGAGVIALNSRLALPTGQINRDDLGTLRINSSGNVVPTINLLQGNLLLNAAGAFANAPALAIGKGATDNVGNKAYLDLNGHTLTLGRITENHADNFNGTPDEGRQWIRCTVPSTLILNDTSADSSYAKVGSVLSGPLTFVKAGSRALNLGHTNALSGAFIVSNGTVNVTSTGRVGPACTNVVVAGGTLSLQNNNALDAAAAVVFAADGTGKIDLPAGVNVTVATLWYGEKQKYGGTYGASGSGARYTDDARFTGAGTLIVLRGNSGTVLTVM